MTLRFCDQCQHDANAIFLTVFEATVVWQVEGYYSGIEQRPL